MGLVSMTAIHYASIDELDAWAQSLVAMSFSS